MQEKEIYQWWQYYGRIGNPVKSNGQCLRVLSSGALNPSRGPDFISARFELNGIIYQGDVECHQNSSDWYRHNHHLDKAYRQVILHLVSQSGNPVKVKSQWCQQPIFTFVLPKPLNSNINPVENCQPGRGFEKTLKSNLISLALDRFNQKINRFTKALNRYTYQELFFVHFFRALGYPNNANTFQLLAQQLNWTWLRQNLDLIAKNDRQLFALYAGYAGFIPTVSRDDFSKDISDLFLHYNYLLPGLSFNPELWQYAGSRPNNHPHFRLATGIQLLRYFNFKLFDELIAHLQQRMDNHLTYTKIAATFKLKPDSYWLTHYALGKNLQRFKMHTSFGEARLTELLINVVLPLAAAQARLSDSEGFVSYIQSFYLSLKLIEPYGCFKKQIAWMEDCFSVFPFQAVNQALLLLNSDYCNLQLCIQCPINRYECDTKGKSIDKKIKNI